MTRLIIIPMLALCACGRVGFEETSDWGMQAEMAWVDLWEMLDDVYGVGDSECMYAIEDTTVVVAPSGDLSWIGCGVDVTGCAISNFPPGVPLGAHTIGLLDGAGRGVLCHSLMEEVIHVADHCLARNEDDWPFPGRGHPDALFDWNNKYSIVSRLDAKAWERCVND